MEVFCGWHVCGSHITTDPARPQSIPLIVPYQNLPRQQLNTSGFIRFSQFICWICLSSSLQYNLILLPLSASICCSSTSMFMTFTLQQGRGAVYSVYYSIWTQKFISGSSPDFVSHFWRTTRPALSSPEYCKHYIACNAVIPRELEIMEASKLLPFKAIYWLLAKGWKVIAKYAQNMVIKEKFYIALIIEEACQTWSNEGVCWGFFSFLLSWEHKVKW